MRGIWPVRLTTPHVHLGVPIREGLRILESTGAPVRELREDDARSHRVDLPEFGMAVHEADGIASAVWYDDPAGRLTPFGRRRKVRLYMARYASGSWRLHAEGGGLVHFLNDGDGVHGLHLVYGAHMDVIRIDRWDVAGSREQSSLMEEQERLEEEIQARGIEAVRRLVETLGGVDARTPVGPPLIDVVTKLGDVESVGYWLDANASPARAVRIAAMNGNLALLEHLLERLTPDLNAVDERGETLLMDAAVGGSIEVVQLLLQRGAHPDTRNRYGRGAAEIAQNKEIRRILLRAGAEPTTPYLRELAARL
jgi:hypothetical protein